MTKENRTRISGNHVSALLNAFRETPGNVTQAAKAAGVHRRTARKAWHEGWPVAGIRPMRETLRAEQEAAEKVRAEVKQKAVREQAEAQAERAYQERELARADVIQARRQEAQIVRAQRGNLMALISVTGNLLRGALKQARELENALAAGIDPATGKRLGAREQVDLLWRIGRMTAQTTKTSREVIKMERLLMGEPTEIIGLASLDFSEEQAIAEIEEAYEAAQRVKARRESGERLN